MCVAAAVGSDEDGGGGDGGGGDGVDQLEDK